MLPPNAMISARSGVGAAGKAQAPSSAKGQPGYRVTTSPARAAEAWAAFTISTVRMPTPASGCG